MVVTSTIAGMKKMKVTRPWVTGKIAQCSATAADGHDRRECVAARRGLLDPRPQPREPQIPGDPR